MIVLSTSTWHNVNILCNIRLNYNSPVTAQKIKKWEKEIVSMLYFLKIGDCFLKIEIKQATLFHSYLFLDEVLSLKSGKQVESTIEVVWWVMRDVWLWCVCCENVSTVMWYAVYYSRVWQELRDSPLINCYLHSTNSPKDEWTSFAFLHFSSALFCCLFKNYTKDNCLSYKYLNVCVCSCVCVGDGAGRRNAARRQWSHVWSYQGSESNSRLHASLRQRLACSQLW